MCKIMQIICFGGIGIMYGIVLIVSWLISMCYLLLTEIIGTRKFKRKFIGINDIIANEFKNTFKTFKSIFELV